MRLQKMLERWKEAIKQNPYWNTKHAQVHILRSIENSSPNQWANPREKTQINLIYIQVPTAKGLKFSMTIPKYNKDVIRDVIIHGRKCRGCVLVRSMLKVENHWKRGSCWLGEEELSLAELVWRAWSYLCFEGFRNGVEFTATSVGQETTFFALFCCDKFCLFQLLQSITDVRACTWVGVFFAMCFLSDTVPAKVDG